jgi:hypothetical protein
MLLELSCCDLGVVLEDALSLVRTFEVFAANTLAVGVARYPTLEALAVLFEAFAFLAVAPFGMAVLTITDYIGGTRVSRRHFDSGKGIS